MPNTIEVPISLIQAGDIDAIRELLPKQNLFGRWAEHPEYGRGIITVAYPDPDGKVWIARESENRRDGADWKRVPLEDLTLDPVELTTVEDFENAPVGKAFDNQWESLNDLLTDKNMASTDPWKILRYGWGE